MPLTLQQLITKTERLLSQSAGTAVQTYAEPRIANYIQDAFDSLFMKAWWPQFCNWETITLDGSTGVPTGAPTTVNRFVDIRTAMPSGHNKKLKSPPSDANPFLYTGTTAMFIEGIAGERVFRIWPFTCTDQIVIHGRLYPGEYAVDEVIPMDPLLLSHLAAWKYCTADGNNPGEAEQLLQTFNTHLDLILHNMQNQGVSLDSRYDNSMTEWVEMPG